MTAIYPEGYGLKPTKAEDNDKSRYVDETRVLEEEKKYAIPGVNLLLCYGLVIRGRNRVWYGAAALRADLAVDGGENDKDGYTVCRMQGGFSTEQAALDYCKIICPQVMKQRY